MLVHHSERIDKLFKRAPTNDQTGVREHILNNDPESKETAASTQHLRWGPRRILQEVLAFDSLNSTELTLQPQNEAVH